MEKTIVERIAWFARNLQYDDLPKNVVEKTKRALLDTFAVAIAAWASPSSKMVRSVVQEKGGEPESTIIGSKGKIPCQNAVLANGVMVRYLDYNDCFYPRPSTMKYKAITGHPSETIPTTLAVGEREHSTGKEVLTNIVLSYQLLRRYSLFMPSNYKEPQGWHQSVLYSLTGAVSAGKLLKLTVDQLANAIAISLISHGPGLGLVDASDEMFYDVKNLMCSLAERDGILAALLAQKGFTGNKRVFEHPRGMKLLANAVDGKFNYEQLSDLERLVQEEGWLILHHHAKYYPAESSAQGLLLALTQLVKQHNIWPKDVKSVHVKCFHRCFNHIFDEAKRYPVNKETADHSAPFIIAATIKDHTFGPDQYRVENINDPLIRKLIGKITSEYDPALDKQREVIIEINTLNDKQYRARDHWHWPMTDEELEEKFRSCASKLLAKGQIEEIMKTVYNLEAINDISELMELLTI